MSGTPKIVMYSTPFCGFCMAARMLLKKKKAEYEDINVAFDQSKREEMERLSGRRTVPQIFIDDHHVGGYDDLNALDEAGELDHLLGSDRGSLNG